MFNSVTEAYINSSTAMLSGMACRTKRNQVPPTIITRVAAKLFVVNLEIGHCAARLAPPTIAT
jgi:hypothetical protein